MAAPVLRPKGPGENVSDKEAPWPKPIATGAHSKDACNFVRYRHAHDQPNACNAPLMDRWSCRINTTNTDLCAGPFSCQVRGYFPTYLLSDICAHVGYPIHLPEPDRLDMSLYKSHNARKPAKFRLSVENRCPSIGHQKKTFACLPH